MNMENLSKLLKEDAWKGKDLRPLTRFNAFPFGLGQAGLHELVEARHGDMTALTGLAFASLDKQGAILWISQHRAHLEYGIAFEPGVQVFLKRWQPILHVYTDKSLDALWAADEALRSGGIGAIIAEVQTADFTATRRLKLASDRSGIPLILLMPHTREGASACETRWRISSQPSTSNVYDPKGLGAPRWRAVLERCRAVPDRMGETFDLEYDDETVSLHLVSRLVSGTIAAGSQDRDDRKFG